jgi:hypothetical protein
VSLHIPRHLLPAVLVALALLPGAARAASTFTPHPDSDAPAGASPSWLPHEEWVGERWMPFDEWMLERKLHMSSREVWQYLSSTGRTIDELARSRGIATKGLATALLANRRLPKRGVRYWTLRSRTQRVLDQGHLAAHMFGHVFHIWAVVAKPQKNFGVSQARFTALFFDRRLTIPQIAEIGGVNQATLRRRIIAAARAAGARGVAAGMMSRRENVMLRARDAAGFSSWVKYRVPESASTASVAVPTRRSVVCELHRV